MKAALFYAAVLSAGTGALLGLNQWAAWLMEHNDAARGFVESPVFTACAILGATVVCVVTFGAALIALGIIPFPRPAGRTASEVAE